MSYLDGKNSDVHSLAAQRSQLLDFLLFQHLERLDRETCPEL